MADLFLLLDLLEALLCTLNALHKGTLGKGGRAGTAGGISAWSPIWGQQPGQIMRTRITKLLNYRGLPQENVDQTVKTTYMPRHADGGPVGFF